MVFVLYSLVLRFEVHLITFLCVCFFFSVTGFQRGVFRCLYIHSFFCLFLFSCMSFEKGKEKRGSLFVVFVLFSLFFFKQHYWRSFPISFLFLRPPFFFILFRKCRACLKEFIGGLLPFPLFCVLCSSCFPVSKQQQCRLFSLGETHAQDSVYTIYIYIFGKWENKTW